MEDMMNEECQSYILQHINFSILFVISYFFTVLVENYLKL